MWRWSSTTTTMLPGYGVFPSEKSSHKTMPKDQTSDWVENTRSMMDSMAIHLTGSGPFFFIALQLQKKKKRTKDNRRPVNNNKNEELLLLLLRVESVHTMKEEEEEEGTDNWIVIKRRRKKEEEVPRLSSCSFQNDRLHGPIQSRRFWQCYRRPKGRCAPPNPRAKS